MKAFVLLIPIVSAALFFGADGFISKETMTIEEKVEAASLAETERVREIAKDPEAATSRDGGQNSLVAWVLAAFSSRGGGESKDGGTFKRSKSSEGSFGFKFGKCSNVGQAKRCRVDN